MIYLPFCSLLSHSLDPSPQLLNPSQNPPLPPPHRRCPTLPPPPLSSTLPPPPPSPTPVVAVFAATSRKKSDVIEVYEEEKVKIYKLLDGLRCKVSLTTDIWTSEHSHVAYCCLIVHFVDDSWELQKKILAFRKMPYPHDGETLFSFMKEMILEWNLDKKLFSIVVDNATNNDVMIRKVKDWILYDLLVARDVDLLHKTNSPRLPVLAKIARDILAVPATTVASEAAFSVGGRIIDESRTCLLPDAVEVLVVADDWIESIPKRTQEALAVDVLDNRLIFPLSCIAAPRLFASLFRNVLKQMSDCGLIPNVSGLEFVHQLSDLEDFVFHNLSEVSYGL
ncbi:putative AC transposase [Sesamum angolense]|uniref:AC transposase n=1 Tax=Sesamum angolense TaxID=2727404 RepID=A0AAE1XH31_9LAMI|nr:putative AC transposase [Sesamum angolense]